MKSFKELREEGMGAPVNAVGGGSIAGTPEAGDDPPVRKKPKMVRRKRFAQCEVFVVSADVYNRCMRPKLRSERFAKHVGTDETGMAIREYAKDNPGKGIMIEDENTGHMTWLRMTRNKCGAQF